MVAYSQWCTVGNHLAFTKYIIAISNKPAAQLINNCNNCKLCFVVVHEHDYKHDLIRCLLSKSFILEEVVLFKRFENKTPTKVTCSMVLLSSTA